MTILENNIDEFLGRLKSKTRFGSLPYVLFYQKSGFLTQGIPRDSTMVDLSQGLSKLNYFYIM